MRGETWTDSKIDLLKKLVAERLTASEIAAAMSQELGTALSKAAIVSKCRKSSIKLLSGLTSGGHQKNIPISERQTFVAKVPHPKPVVAQKAVSIADAFSEGFEGQTGRVAIWELGRNHCRFPIDQEVGPVRYCGLEADGAYCPYHKARCDNKRGFQPPSVLSAHKFNKNMVAA